jgi:general secretion pathway protein G
MTKGVINWEMKMKGNMRNVRARVRAFTLLEVLMVVVIIGLLAAFAAPSFFGAGEKAKKDLAQSTVNSGFSNALEIYRANVGTYPQSDQGGLKLLLEAPQDEVLAKKWAGPYLPKASALQDPWGKDYLYECPGKYNEKSYDLSSSGPDGQSGTDDDIKNWDQT